MLKQFIKSRIAIFEKELGYDAAYLRDVLDTDLGLFMLFARLQGISKYRHEVPVDVWHAARLAGAMESDCGPCSQLMIAMAEKDQVDPAVLRAVAAFDDAALSEEARLGVQFVRAVLARDPEADTLREQVVARWGKRGLLTFACALIASRIYPTLKYALGYGRACTRLQIKGQPVTVQREQRTLTSVSA